MIPTDTFTKTFEEFTLTVPELFFAPGTVTALLGPNGCGKSTLGRCLAGILPTDQNVSPVHARVGFSAQVSYPFRMSLRKNVLTNCTDPGKADALIEALDLSSLAGQNAKKLSGGQTARMALARILAGSYDLVILDEPTASMDMRSTILAENCIREYAAHGGSVLLITHSLAQARRIAGRILLLSSGELVEDGPVSTVLEHPSDPRAAEFLEFYHD